jgi:microcin C transport system permease protein
MIADKNGWILWPPIPFSYDTPNKNPPMAFPVKPTWMLTKEDCEAAIKAAFHPCNDELEWNWLGTDDQGRDVIARVIYGFRISVLFGLVLTFFASIIGVAAGAVQGYFGGWTDLLFSASSRSGPRCRSFICSSSSPAVIEPSFWILLGILLAFSWVALVGVVRAEFLRARNFEYVTAARALGLSNLKIIFKHLLPNAMVATLTFMPFILNGSISTLTSLDFLGVGLPAGSPSLGELLAQGKDNLQAPWLGLTAFFVIAIMLSLLIFIGEAVRDALDPRKSFG